MQMEESWSPIFHPHRRLSVFQRHTRQEAREAAKMVKDDLERLELVTSPEKFQWDPVQRFELCGFQWDLKEFRVEVTKEKRDRIKSMARCASQFIWHSAGGVLCLFRQWRSSDWG